MIFLHAHDTNRKSNKTRWKEAEKARKEVGFSRNPIPEYGTMASRPAIFVGTFSLMLKEFFRGGLINRIQMFGHCIAYIDKIGSRWFKLYRKKSFNTQRRGRGKTWQPSLS